jgi:hypothetical protein
MLDGKACHEERLKTRTGLGKSNRPGFKEGAGKRGIGRTDVVTPMVRSIRKESVVRHVSIQVNPCKIGKNG